MTILFGFFVAPIVIALNDLSFLGQLQIVVACAVVLIEVFLIALARLIWIFFGAEGVRNRVLRAVFKAAAGSVIADYYFYETTRNTVVAILGPVLN